MPWSVVVEAEMHSECCCHSWQQCSCLLYTYLSTVACCVFCKFEVPRSNSLVSVKLEVIVVRLSHEQVRGRDCCSRFVSLVILTISIIVVVGSLF